MMTKTAPPIPEDNQSHKGAGSAPSVPLDTTKGHRDDEKNNIREQAAHGNLTQNTSNRRSCLLYTSPSPRDGLLSRMPSSA